MKPRTWSAAADVAGLDAIERFLASPEAIKNNALTLEGDQKCLQLLAIRFHKLWNWKFTIQMNLLFQITTRQLFRPFEYPSVVSRTS